MDHVGKESIESVRGLLPTDKRGGRGRSEFEGGSPFLDMFRVSSRLPQKCQLVACAARLHQLMSWKRDRPVETSDESHAPPADTSEGGGSYAETCRGRTNTPRPNKRKTQNSGLVAPEVSHLGLHGLIHLKMATV